MISTLRLGTSKSLRILTKVTLSHFLRSEPERQNPPKGGFMSLAPAAGFEPAAN